MPFQNFDALEQSDQPTITVRRGSIAFNAAFIDSAIDKDNAPKRCQVIVDEDSKQLGFRLGGEGFSFNRDGANSKGRAIQSLRLFREIEWIKQGKYQPRFDATEKAWLIKFESKETK